MGEVRNERVGPRTALRHEQRTWAVAAISFLAAALLSGGGWLLRSASLAGEGLHALAHVAAFAVAGLAYAVARRLAAAGRERSARLAPDIAGACNGALLLALAWELALLSAGRLLRPTIVDLPPALGLAVFGLAVNLLSAAVLRHAHGQEHGHAADVNFRGVYVHVLSDTLVAVLTIVGLLVVRFTPWTWADGAAGLTGAALVALFGLRLLVVGARAVSSDLAAQRRAAG